MSSWYDLINTAQTRPIPEGKDSPEFTHKEMVLAQHWTTCAIAELGSNVERRVGGAPKDYHLLTLGSSFCFAIRGNRFDKARRLLTLIKKRVVIIS